MRQIAPSWYETLMGQEHDTGSLNRDGSSRGPSIAYEMMGGSPGSAMRADSITDIAEESLLGGS